ncbi:PD-(D/E)XK nuclease family protein [Mesorhizobium sp. LMG 17147]|uniref:PDDEXK-like family protein n=1 Tax=Mesorhizobium sp. LMG 17147 TaxID=2963091 RepID=UPI0020CA0587|nr:PD-(D/E)XK nuclease family protein [Mesorhizobium sp. LMG 17147]MCP9231050.1 PD-(D/E)XK nuclease family protein [Mesorhizobium sp. LMG 17147]
MPVINQHALEALVVANPDFEAIERSRSVFCPFEAVGMVRQEIRHGHFLGYCLDPQRPHGFGSECLRALLRSAAYAHRSELGEPRSGAITPLSVHLMDFEKAQIRREWRGIDLLAIVNDEKLAVAIELKIDSTEHSGQLRRYREQITQQWKTEHGWRHLFLYLTKHGDEASDEDGEGWLALHLDMVANEFDSVVQRQMGTPEALGLLRAYLAMLRRHHLTDEYLEELATKLWSQHREALNFLMERRPDAASELFAQIYERRAQLAQIMTARSGLEIVPDDSSRSIVRFAIKEWDTLPDFLTAQRWTSTSRLLLMEFQSDNDKRNLRVRFVLGPSDPARRKAYYQALVAAGVPTTKKKITDSYTRLATKSVRVADDDDSETKADLYDRVVSLAEAYARDIIPAYNAAIASLRG